METKVLEEKIFIENDLEKKGFYYYDGIDNFDIINANLDYFLDEIKGSEMMIFFSIFGFLIYISMYTNSYINPIFMLIGFPGIIFFPVSIWLFGIFCISIFYSSFMYIRFEKIVFIKNFYFYGGKINYSDDYTEITPEIIKNIFSKNIGKKLSGENAYFDKKRLESELNLIEKYLFSDKSKNNFKNIFSKINKKIGENFMPKNNFLKIFFIFIYVPIFILTLIIILVSSLSIFIGNILKFPLKFIFIENIFEKIEKNVKILEKESIYFKENIEIFQNYSKTILKIGKSSKNILELSNKITKKFKENSEISEKLKNILNDELKNIFLKINQILEKNIFESEEKLKEISGNEKFLILEKGLFYD